MRTDRKRKVVEALLCATDCEGCGATASSVAHHIGRDLDVQLEAQAAWDCVSSFLYTTFEEDACEAAYRLIESSPTLIREFFHRSAP